MIIAVICSSSAHLDPLERLKQTQQRLRHRGCTGRRHGTLANANAGLFTNTCTGTLRVAGLPTQEGDVVCQEQEIALEQQRANKRQYVGDGEVTEKTGSEPRHYTD